MYKNKRILAVVPARGGSKGLKLKNLRPINGVPMVALVGSVVEKIEWIDRAVVSTDHEKIARVAEEAGLDAPFRRPESLSGDQIGDLEVLTHALLTTEQLEKTQYDIVVMLQPTSPLRRPEHVKAAIRILVDEAWDAVWTVSESDSKAHPLKQLTIDADSNEMNYFDPAGDRIIARQQLNPVYHRNGIAYALTRSCIVDQKTIKGQRTRAMVLDGHFVSIDTEWDIKLVEFIRSEFSA